MSYIKKCFDLYSICVGEYSDDNEFEYLIELLNYFELQFYDLEDLSSILSTLSFNTNNTYKSCSCKDTDVSVATIEKMISCVFDVYEYNEKHNWIGTNYVFTFRHIKSGRYINSSGVINSYGDDSGGGVTNWKEVVLKSKFVYV